MCAQLNMDRADVAEPDSPRSEPSVRRRLVRLIGHPIQTLERVYPWLRAVLLLRSCTSVGVRPRVWGRLRVENLGRIEVGDRLRVRAVPWETELVALPGGTLEIGSGVFINSGTSICAGRRVVIGDGCQIGPRVLIMDNDFHTAGNPGQRPQSLPVVLEQSVWVGAGAIILKGVRVGRGASIGAGSVVTRDVAPGEVVGGVPARTIRPQASVDTACR